MLSQSTTFYNATRADAWHLNYTERNLLWGKVRTVKHKIIMIYNDVDLWKMLQRHTSETPSHTKVLLY